MSDGIKFRSHYVIGITWYDCLVACENQVMRPHEITAMEAYTGSIVSWRIIPLTWGDDERTVLLSDANVRYLLSDLLCRVGVSRCGAKIVVGENAIKAFENVLSDIGPEIQKYTSSQNFISVEKDKHDLFAVLDDTWNIIRNQLKEYEWTYENGQSRVVSYDTFINARTKIATYIDNYINPDYSNCPHCSRIISLKKLAKGIGFCPSCDKPILPPK